MLRICRSLVRSQLDYGSVVYGSTYSSYLKMYDCVLMFLKHLFYGKYIEANKPPLYRTRLKLSLQLCTVRLIMFMMWYCVARHH